MLRYDRQTKPGLVALYDIRPGNGAGPFLQPRNPHEAEEKVECQKKFIAEFPSKPDLGEAAGACVSQPDSWRWPAEVTPDRRLGTFPPGVHRWSDQAVASTSSRLHSSTRRAFWTHTLVMFDICTDVHFDSHMYVLLSIVDTFVLGVTSLNPL